MNSHAAAGGSNHLVRCVMSVNMNNVASPPVKHHYVPQFYQRGFIRDKSNRIWVYERGREPRQYSVRKTGMKIALYGFTNQQKELDTRTVEVELAKIDNDGAKVIQKLEKTSSLSDKERRRLCRFVSVMWRRTPKHKEQAEKMAAEMMPRFFEEHDDEWLCQIINERLGTHADAERKFEEQRVELLKLRDQYTREVPDFLFATNVLRDSMFEQVLYRMDWAFFRATPTTEFLTCDNPILFSKGSGLKDREAVIMFPLSSKLFLQAMWISTYGNTYQGLTDAQIQVLNRYVVQNAHKQVYSSTASKEVSSLVDEVIGTM